MKHVLCQSAWSLCCLKAPEQELEVALNRNWMIWVRHSFSFMFNCFLASSLFSNLSDEETWKDKSRTDHKPHQLQQEQEQTSARWAVPNHPHDFTATWIVEVFHGIIYIWWFFFSSSTDETNEGYFQWQEMFILFSCIALGSEQELSCTVIFAGSL